MVSISVQLDTTLTRKVSPRKNDLSVEAHHYVVIVHYGDSFVAKEKTVKLLSSSFFFFFYGYYYCDDTISISLLLLFIGGFILVHTDNTAYHGATTQTTIKCNKKRVICPRKSSTVLTALGFLKYSFAEISSSVLGSPASGKGRYRQTNNSNRIVKEARRNHAT